MQDGSQVAQAGIKKLKNGLTSCKTLFSLSCVILDHLSEKSHVARNISEVEHTAISCFSGA